MTVDGKNDLGGPEEEALLHHLDPAERAVRERPAVQRVLQPAVRRAAEAEERSTKLRRPVPWTQTVVLVTAVSIPIALNRWSLDGFQAAAGFLALMAATGIVAALFGRRSRAALILYFVALVVVSASICIVIIT